MRKFNLLFLLTVLSLMSASCSLQNKVDNDKKAVLKNFVSLDSGEDRKIGDDNLSFDIRRDPGLMDHQDTLIVGYPLELIGQQNTLGASVISVSDEKDEALGSIKMSSLSLYHVRTVLKSSPQGKELVFKGCFEKCSETSESKEIIRVPVLSTDEKNRMVYLDLSALGRGLDFVSHLAEGDSEESEPWKFISARTVSYDYSLSTLVFDVMTDYDAKMGEETKRVTLGIRWYLRLASQGTPFFKSRPPTPEVGYFSTSRNAETWIKRFRTSSESSGPIKYYVKHVPARYRAGFVEGFEAWNEKLLPILKTKFVEYEFLEDNDPRNQVIVAGDVRYNVIEWDLKNAAGYGGLGPSVCDQNTGEIYSAQVLVQGPKIEELYLSWFKAQNEADLAQVQRMVARPQNQIQWKAQFAGVPLDVPSQDPTLMDPFATRMDFNPPPAGYTYDSYMQNYFRDLVAHELGHNFGLSHNFKGNLAANESGQMGSVSRSVMEYLNASYRHLDTVGEYDVMAIAYGYLGQTPQHKNWFCWDLENTNSPKDSPECSHEDATADPVGFFQGVLRKALEKTVALGQKQKPDWTVPDLARQIDYSVRGLSRYAVSAPFTFANWTNFGLVAGRPTQSEEVSSWILESMNKIVCSADWDTAVGEKEGLEAQAATLENLKAARSLIAEKLSGFKKPFPLGSKDFFPCLEFKK